jgi:ankyrin repeat protein
VYDTLEAGCRQDDSLPVVESLGDATPEALIQSVEDVPQEALSQSLEELHPAFEAACNMMRNKRNESVAPRHLGVLGELVHVEQAYVAELRECHETFTSESRADIRTGGQINVCIGGGYTPDRQKARHAVKRDVAWSDVALKHAEGEEAARKRHRERLKMLAEKFKADFPGDCFMNDIPVNQHSKDCLQEVVDESTRETTEVNYTEALKKLGVLSLPPNSKGRKASTTARETPLTEMEEGSVYDWGSAWLKLGGFTSCTDKDKNGWTPLHHAIDSMTFSMRARHSAIALATRTPDSALEAATTGHQPPGWTALHFACEGSDVGLKKLDVVKILLGRRANVEARDAKGNTPLLLAAGTGVTDVCTTLLDYGADKDVTNINDHGAYRIADGCSRTLAEILLARGCPETHSQKSGRTRQGMSQSRLLRGSMTTSASSGYTSLSAARSYQQAPKVKGKKNCNWP